MKRKNRLLHSFNNLKIGEKIMIAFVMASIVPILIIQVIGYNMNSNSLKRKIDTLMVNNLTQLSERVELTIGIYTSLIYQIYVDDIIVENVNVLLDENNKNSEMAYSTIYARLLQQVEHSSNGVRSISIICSNGKEVTYDTSTASSIVNLWSSYEDIRNILPYQNTIGQKGKVVVTPTMRISERGEDKYYFHLSKCMYDYNNLEKGSIATIVMSVDQSVLKDICAVSIEEDEAEYNINFITDKERNVISYPDVFFTGIPMNPELSVEEFVAVTGLLKGQDTAVNRYVDETSGWIFYNVYNKSFMMRDIKSTQIIFIVISILAILFSSVLIFYIVRKIGSSVNIIIGGIKEVQKGNLSVTVELDSKDELGQIASNFNDMTQKVSGLIEEVTVAIDRQKDAEIRALEAQINPHFLYNTLDSINWMAIEKEEYEISRMLRNLGVILRYSINKSNQMVTIEETCDWLDKYISLQQMRFNNSFEYQVSAGEEVKQINVYKLLFQPFIENSIIHGFKGMENGGLIHIDLFLSEQKDKLHVVIEDNGKGMDRVKVELFNNRKEAVKDEGTSIGIHNAFARMDMYYGESADWNVSSIKGMGTVITLRIPIQ